VNRVPRRIDGCATQCTSLCRCRLLGAEREIPRSVSDKFPAFHGQQILDLGCGPPISPFNLHALPAARVVGTDGAGAMLDIARKTILGMPPWPIALMFEVAYRPGSKSLWIERISRRGQQQSAPSHA